MTLPSGADITLDGVEYILDKGRENHYVHQHEPLFAQATAIAGEIAKQQLRPERVLWSWTNWSGGEGAPVYYPEKPTAYDVGSLVNVTQAGSLTTRPRRYRANVARSGSQVTTGHRPAGGSTWDKSIILWGDNALFSRDGRGWAAGSGATSTASYQYFDGDSDGRYMVVGVINEGATTDILPAADGTTPSYADLFTGTTILNAPYVAEVLNGVWYAWGIQGSGTPANSLSLIKGGVLSTTNGGTLIYPSSLVPSGAWGSSYWTDIESAESSLYFSFGTPSGSVVFVSEEDVGRPYWTSPAGFCAKKLVYQEGVLFILGSHNSAGKKFAEVWAIPTITGSPLRLGSPRKHRNEELGSWEAGCAGPDATVFMADCDSGKIFVYDMEHEAFSLFDDLANGGTGDGTSFTTFGNLLMLGASTFESGNITTSGWVQESGSVSVTGPTVAGTALAARTGLYSLQSTPFTSGAYVATTQTGISGIPISASTTYTALGYARAGGASGDRLTMGIRWYDSTGTIISTSTGSSFAMSTTYAQYSVTATSPANAVYAALAVTKTGTATSSSTDDVFFFAGSSTSLQDRIAGMWMHGSRLIVPTWTPGGSGTSQQILTYEDFIKDNRDGSQAIVGTVESGQWDFGVPQEEKGLVGFYVNFDVADSGTASGLAEGARIIVGYAMDEAISTDPIYTLMDPITSDTETDHLGRVFVPVSDDVTTETFTRLKLFLQLDNSATAVQPPVLNALVTEAVMLSHAETWQLFIQVQEEANNKRPSDVLRDPSDIRDHLLALAENKRLVKFEDGARYDASIGALATEHLVMVEEVTDVITDKGEGSLRVVLRAVGP